MLILICDPFDKSLPGRLARFGEVTDDLARLPEATVALIRSKTFVDRAFMDKAPKLGLVVRGGVGLDNVDRDYAKVRGVVVRNTPEASAVAVAEQALAFMLAAPNRLVEAHNLMREGKFPKNEIKRTELLGKTLCLVGMGMIATEVAKRARAFGMRIIAQRASGAPSEWAEVRPHFEDAFPDADYISLHVPLTDATRGMINARTIGLMRPGVFLINTARGKCVVEQDLADALRSGKVGYYCTDVYQSDPPPPDSPILAAPNVLMAPHIGGSSKENLLRIGDRVVEILDEFTSWPLPFGRV